MKPPPSAIEEDETLPAEEGSSLGFLRRVAHVPDCSLGPAAAPATPLPQRVGRFLILGRLGEGGMGQVFSAYDPELDRKVAVKLVRGLANRSPATVARVKREAQAMARVSHPNVVNVYEVGESEGQVFIVMEIVDGGSLSGWQRERDPAAPGEVPRRLRAYLQAATGLLGAHRCGLIHRDFKPQNVLIGKDGRVRVADFGLARLLDGAGGAEEAADGGDAGSGPRLTQAGAIMGTPGYMSPEQVRGAEADERSDQFSFCASLYEALYGQQPFPGAPFEDYARSVCDGEVRQPPPSEVPVVVQQAILRGLSADPAARFPSMQGLIAAIESGLDADAESLTTRADRIRLAVGLAVWLGLIALSNILVGKLTGALKVQVWPLAAALELCVTAAAVMIWPPRAVRQRRRFRRMMAFFLFVSCYVALVRVFTRIADISRADRLVLECIGGAALFALESLHVGWRHGLLALLVLAMTPVIWLVPEWRLVITNLLFLVVCACSIHLHTRQPAPEPDRPGPPPGP